jgi:uncharacterized membrane protein
MYAAAGIVPVGVPLQWMHCLASSASMHLNRTGYYNTQNLFEDTSHVWDPALTATAAYMHM